MLITVNENIKTCYLALNQWTEAEGYNVRVGEFGFYVIFGLFEEGEVVIVEENTGTMMMEIPYDDMLYDALGDKENLKGLLKFTGKYIKGAIENTEDFEGDLVGIKQKVLETLGEKPD